MKKLIFTLTFLLATYIQVSSQAVIYNYTGGVQTYVVPPCVFFIDVIAEGAEGGGAGGSGGDGSIVTGTFAVVPGQILEVYVGGMGAITAGGFNGGGIGKPGASGSGGGGGGSDVRIAPYAAANRIIVAGGGGGTGGGTTLGMGGSGGDPDGTTGSGFTYGDHGLGGTTIAGGLGGAPWGPCGSAGTNGTLVNGGAGGTDNCYGLGPGAGGGGGLYGGGGGGADDWPSGSLGGGAGGGGSSLIPGGGTATLGGHTGNGLVTIIPAGGTPIVTVIVATPTICNGTGTLMTAAGALTYVWSPATGLSSTTGTSVTASPTTTTTYTVVGTDVCGTGSTTATVTVLPKPIPNFSIIPETCAGDDSSTIVMSPVGTGPYTYTINGVAGSGTFVPLAPGSYTIVTTDGNTCVEDTVITVSPGPACCSLTLSSVTSNVCPGICNGTATASYLLNVSTPTVSWLNSSFAPIGQTSFTATGLCAGTYYAAVTDSTLCTILETVVIGNFPGVTITGINSVAALCNGNCNGTLTVSHTGGTLFSIDNGASFQASNIFTGLCAGTYPVLVMNANGCSAVSSATVSEPAPLALVIDNIIHAKCFGSSDGAINTTAGGGTTPYTVAWSNGSSNLDNINIPAGPYTLILTDFNGCTISVNGTVNEPPVLTLTVNPVNPSCYDYCDGTATAVAAGGTFPYNYNWAGGIGASTSAVASNLCDGNYSLTVSDANACSVFSAFTLTEPIQVAVGVITLKDEKCFGSCDGYIVVNSPVGTGFSINGGLTYFANNTFLGLCEGDYDVYVKDINGCMNNQVVTINRPIEIVSEFTFGPQPIDFFQTNITFENLSTNANLYTWYYDSLGTSAVFEEEYFFPSYVAGDYTVCLVAANDSGCFDSTCHVVVIDDYTYLYLPNAFTPDGNGTNDLFKPVINYIDENTYTFRIFNRWGETIFFSKDMTEGWDGNHNSIKCKEDVYVWKVRAKSQLNSEVKEWTGHVNLLR